MSEQELKIAMNLFIFVLLQKELNLSNVNL